MSSTDFHTLDVSRGSEWRISGMSTATTRYALES